MTTVGSLGSAPEPSPYEIERLATLLVHADEASLMMAAEGMYMPPDFLAMARYLLRSGEVALRGQP